VVCEIIVAFLGTLPLDLHPESKPFTPLRRPYGGRTRVTRAGLRIIPRQADGEHRRRLPSLPVTVDHAIAAGRLPLLHRDPFDRMLVAQARCEGLTLVTRDPQIHRYEVTHSVSQRAMPGRCG
jgi:PIN domain